MKKLFTVKRIFLALLLIFGGMQLFRVDTSNPPAEAQKDFIAATNAPTEVAAILKKACYDCHSHETVYPWYFQIAPVSWWVKNHVNEGREELNFSVWADYKSRKKDHKMEEAVELVEENEMPMESYTWVHKNAKLSASEKTQLVNFFKSQRTGESDKE